MPSYIICGVGVVLLCCFLLKRDNKSSVIAISLKTLTSLCFIACGISSFLCNIANGGEIFTYHLLGLGLLLMGLVFGMVGDILLDFKIYFKTLNMRFLCLEYERDFMMITGMASFALGHVCYIGALSFLNPDSSWYLFIAAPTGLCMIALVMLLSVKVMKMDFRKFLIPCIIYGFLLATFMVYSLIILFNKEACAGNIILGIGSALFVVSDLVLCITYFSKPSDYQRTGISNPESKLMIVLNHVTYYAAQFLIAVGILFL